MSTFNSSCSYTLEFQPPANLEAIRSTLLQRIYQKRQESAITSTASLPSSPATGTTVSLLDHGLPSPPFEYQKKQDDHRNNNIAFNGPLAEEDEEDDAVSTISSLPPTTINTTSVLDASPSLPTTLNAEQVEMKIKQLKEEKHRLFTQMKNLLQQQESTVPILEENNQQQQTTTTFKVKQYQDLVEEEENHQPPSLPSPSPSPTTTPKTMTIPSYKQPSKPTSRSYQRRVSPGVMNLSTRYSTMMGPSSMTMDNNGRYRYSPYGVYFTSSSSTASSTSSSSTSSPPPTPGYNVRRSSHMLSSRSSSISTATPSNNRYNRPLTFRPSRFLVNSNRHIPRY
ncbi:hypothetical protein BC941DRAFT_382281 [Chlamydoabsidia padenii]|nr:hypothetical protein BC941DRAFT_382281 [Chlamydoabsidia padenii]